MGTTMIQLRDETTTTNHYFGKLLAVSSKADYRQTKAKANSTTEHF